jgi:hypothetical protein
LKGKGDFDKTFASQAFTLFIPTFIFMWIPETLLAPFLIASGMNTIPWPAWAENLRVFVLPFIWIFIISIIALNKVHDISWWKEPVYHHNLVHPYGRNYGGLYQMSIACLRLGCQEGKEAQETRRDDAESGGQTVHAVSEVHGVGDGHHPQYGGGKARRD